MYFRITNKILFILKIWIFLAYFFFYKRHLITIFGVETLCKYLKEKRQWIVFYHKTIPILGKAWYVLLKILHNRLFIRPRLSQFAMKVNLDLFDLSKSKEVSMSVVRGLLDKLTLCVSSTACKYSHLSWG